MISDSEEELVEEEMEENFLPVDLLELEGDDFRTPRKRSNAEDEDESEYFDRSDDEEEKLMLSTATAAAVPKEVERKKARYLMNSSGMIYDT